MNSNRYILHFFQREWRVDRIPYADDGHYASSMPVVSWHGVLGGKKGVINFGKKTKKLSPPFFPPPGNWGSVVGEPLVVKVHVFHECAFLVVILFVCVFVCLVCVRLRWHDKRIRTSKRNSGL